MFLRCSDEAFILKRDVGSHKKRIVSLIVPAAEVYSEHIYTYFNSLAKCIYINHL